MTNIELFKMILVFYIFLTLFCGFMLGTMVNYNTIKHNIKEVFKIGVSPLQFIALIALPVWLLGLAISFVLKLFTTRSKV